MDNRNDEHPKDSGSPEPVRDDDRRERQETENPTEPAPPHDEPLDSGKMPVIDRHR
jgi:hypothetical protein